MFTKLPHGTWGISQLKVDIQATDTDDLIVYNNTTDTLPYDTDNSAATQVATVGVELNMANADIVVI